MCFVWSHRTQACFCFSRVKTKDWLGRYCWSHRTSSLIYKIVALSMKSLLCHKCEPSGMLIYFFCLKVTFKIYIKGNESTFFLLHYWICRYLIVFCNLFFLLAKSSMSCFWWIGHPYEHHESGHCLSLFLLIQWAIFFSWFLKTYIQPRKHLLYIWSAVSILLIYCHDV